MRFHYWLGVGHTYSHRPGILTNLGSALYPTAQTEDIETIGTKQSLTETTHWQHAADDENEEGEDHVGIEESFTPMQMGANPNCHLVVLAITATDPGHCAIANPWPSIYLDHHWPPGTSKFQLRQVLVHCQSIPDGETVKSIQMHPTYLYVHESDQVYMMVQLDHEEHPFSAFKNRHFYFIGYMAAHGEVSPLYCDELSEVERPWLQKLNVVGVLSIPDDVGVIHDHLLFAELV
ncbi:hypothetical protein EV702DRAFT_1051111 [Suillus placidus]|uniref:Uncharacterized protein n=1 Tax=Suillus placidus TaxID=48579 RepID=A0A9P6ZGJ5_9AGAM|nr:hypothetical protein EV702DRAFT_1051111 [Suillus placidus]